MCFVSISVLVWVEVGAAAVQDRCGACSVPGRLARRPTSRICKELLQIYYISGLIVSSFLYYRMRMVGFTGTTYPLQGSKTQLQYYRFFVGEKVGPLDIDLTLLSKKQEATLGPSPTLWLIARCLVVLKSTNLWTRGGYMSCYGISDSRGWGLRL